ncbi:MAG: hypothetical protein JF592_18480 [Microbacterium sp.]|uniref:replication protein RepA n=1 Tax=Microbacterium sp. TaxID=51671 RepID=UPI001E133473|nr:replication protein RepA [Microbacterium sp.]MBW8764536.1 hypothetical protein [Microbacterium sp.]
MSSVEKTGSEQERRDRRTIPAAPTSFRDQASAIADLDGDVPEIFKGYVSRVFTQTCLPYRDPMASNPNLRAWERRNGDMLLAVEPARIVTPEGVVKYEMPFGKYPRLVLPWLTTQIVLQQGNREADGSLPVEFSASLPKFMAELGQDWGGRKGKLVLEQLPRLFGARISVTETTKTAQGSGMRTSDFQIAKNYQLWWDNEGSLSAEGLWGNTVVFAPDFVSDLLETPITIDLRAIALMAKHGPIAMDILTWLNYRLPRASTNPKAPVTWDQINNQFGAQYAQTRQFKAQFLSKLPAVTAVYRDARFDVEENGLRLYKSAPMVQRKALGG